MINCYRINNKAVFFILIFLTVGITNAQTLIFQPTYLKCEIDSLTKIKILTSLDTLFAQIKREKIEDNLINKANFELNTSIFRSFSGMEEQKEDSIISDFYKKQLINIYPVSTNEYWITLAYIGNKNNGTPILKSIINLIATNTGTHTTFSIPTEYLTKTWKKKTIGNISYIFKDQINMERATKFNAKNTAIATKLGLPPEKLTFYLCNNYQEILQLLGYEYNAEANGNTREGYGVDSKTIFSISNNEDFSHDIFHYYSDKMRGGIKQNRTVEEGIAYSWGNAYYTKTNGEMIEQAELVQALKDYLKANPASSPLELFNKDTKIFSKLPAEIAVKSVISGLLCDQVALKKGLEGIKVLVKCGPGDGNFFKALNDLVAINLSNFDTEVMKLVAQKK